MTFTESNLLYSCFDTEFNMQEYRPFHQKLSDHLVVYARVNDPGDTFIIRNNHENTHFTCFGVKTFDTINRFYVLLWDIIVRNRVQLSEKDIPLKYIETRDGTVDFSRNGQIINTKYGIKTIYTLDDEIQIEYYREQNQFMMYNLKNQLIDCGVILDLRHVIELVDYLSTRFNLCNFLKRECVPNVYLYDEFF